MSLHTLVPSLGWHKSWCLSLAPGCLHTAPVSENCNQQPVPVQQKCTHRLVPAWGHQMLASPTGPEQQYEHVAKSTCERIHTGACSDAKIQKAPRSRVQHVQYVCGPAKHRTVSILNQARNKQQEVPARQCAVHECTSKVTYCATPSQACARGRHPCLPMTREQTAGPLRAHLRSR